MARLIMLAFVLLLSHALALPVLAQQSPPVNSLKAEDPKEGLVRKIASELRCAVCQSQSVYDSNADLAKDMLQVVRDKVHEGMPEDEIRRYFLDRYGDYIYMEPVMNSRNLALWAGPFAALLLGGLGLWFAIRSWYRPKSTSAASNNQTPAQAKAADTMHNRIQQELDRIDM
ncbi:cytochrome C biogenesis protein [Magnetococcus marinus MC-1]|uniref:Cytochrome c-type biogenesis protein n=1 Tax=Magnetococcus marinus (strain ATCC BAA-1437 / JCM 17883 / MC-1) TaxID=156889 RepID=A0LDE6_MAGMM|nr:cytochrome c-type biogenesis protein [Magnetococcus marinus]ABK45989.1 cytochrome C biogenesis protein [Magnetococcus marinus MC-1]